MRMLLRRCSTAECLEVKRLNHRSEAKIARSRLRACAIRDSETAMWEMSAPAGWSLVQSLAQNILPLRNFVVNDKDAIIRFSLSRCDEVPSLWSDYGKLDPISHGRITLY
jgi:hypothetical protein